MNSKIYRLKDQFIILAWKRVLNLIMIYFCLYFVFLWRLDCGSWKMKSWQIFISCFGGKLTAIPLLWQNTCLLLSNVGYFVILADRNVISVFGLYLLRKTVHYKVHFLHYGTKSIQNIFSINVSWICTYYAYKSG